MSNPDDRTREENLAELDAMIAEQDRKHEERRRETAARYRDPSVQRGASSTAAGSTAATAPTSPTPATTCTCSAAWHRSSTATSAAP